MCLDQPLSKYQELVVHAFKEVDCIFSQKECEDFNEYPVCKELRWKNGKKASNGTKEVSANAFKK